MPSPSTAVGRTTSLKNRADVAVFGIMGVDVNLTELTDAERECLRRCVAFYKEHRRLFQFGEFHRLVSPFERDFAAWMAVSPDHTEAVLGYYRLLAVPNENRRIVRLRGLKHDALYDVREVDFTAVEPGQATCRPGDELMHAGFVLPLGGRSRGDHISHVWKLEVASL
jgi:alpha-galactosidase